MSDTTDITAVKPWAYLIAGPRDESGEMTYWSNQDGWVAKDSADTFWSNEAVCMPMDAVGPVMIQHEVVVSQDGFDELTADELCEKYSPQGDGEHPYFTREVWREQVMEGSTISGYWDWVSHIVALSNEGEGEL